MTVPNEFEFASDEFSHFLRDARDVAALTSTHQAFTMTQGVLQAFRRRLSVADALAFAQVLPVGLRALFVNEGFTSHILGLPEDESTSVLEQLFDLPAMERTPERADTMLAPAWAELQALEPAVMSGE